MSKTKYIKIEKPKILKNRILLSKLYLSRSLKKYFRSRFFFAEYDKDIQNVSTSILEIPVISNILPLAWAEGANIYVEELDKRYSESLNRIKLVMKGWYPKLSFSTDINVEEIVSNSSTSEGNELGLLFSGGIDSTSSYIRHKNKKPNLIMVWGADIPLDRKEFWMGVKKKYKKFANQENMKISFIKTNMRQFMNEKLLTIKFGSYLTASDWWGALHHGVGLLGLCAPIAVSEQIGTILIPSSHTRELFEYRWGSHPLIDNQMSWANTKVIHDGYDLSRQEKIRYVLKDRIRNSKRYPPLRVCWSQFRDFNCGKCEKCSRTIAGLVLENIDPNKCGFNIESGFFNFLRQLFIEGKFSLSPGKVFLWKDIQRQIPKVMKHNLYGCKEFFTWFRGFNISRIETQENTTIVQRLLNISKKLPEPAQDVILQLYLKILEREEH